MKRSSEQQPFSLQETARPDLVFPDAPDFVSAMPRASMEQMLPWMEEMRRSFPQSLLNDGERLRRKVDIEFIL